MNNSLIFYKNNQPLICIPIDVPLKVSLSAVTCLPSHTLIRKIFKAYMCLSVVYYNFISKFFSINNRNKLDTILEQWMTEVPYKLYDDKLYPVFIWSLVEGRERYYVHLIDKDGTKRYFGKITTKQEDYALLENEKKQLEYFLAVDSFEVPTVIDFKINNKYCSLVTSYLSDDYKLYHPDSNNFPNLVFEEISKNKFQIKYEEIQNTQWGKKSQKYIDVATSFGRYMKNIDKNTKVTISRVHGDFGSENIFINNNGKFYIIDWERSTDLAPYKTDVIAFWLGKKHITIKNDSTKAYKEFKEKFKDCNQIDIALGLLFLISVNFDLAIKIIEKWDKN